MLRDHLLGVCKELLADLVLNRENRFQQVEFNLVALAMDVFLIQHIGQTVKSFRVSFQNAPLLLNQASTFQHILLDVFPRTAAENFLPVRGGRFLGTL